jgi:hypothetical protein
MTLGAQLQRLAADLLASEAQIEDWTPTVGAMRCVFERASGFTIEEDAELRSGRLALPSGVAVSPMQAARCVTEPARTAIFVRGLAAAVSSVHRSLERPVRVLYAGCGPYATLLAPVMALHGSAVDATLLEVNRDSLASAARTLDRLGLSARLVEVDATTYQIPADRVPDIILSETMNAALSQEPQVSIVRHLARQAPRALLVPSRISVEACLLDPAREHVLVPSDHNGPLPEPDRHRVHLGSVFVLDREAIDRWEEVTGDLPAACITVPDTRGSSLELRLLTTVEVAPGHVVRDYDSGMTFPRSVAGFEHREAERQVQFSYRLGSDPGLVWTDVAGAEAGCSSSL